MSSVLSTGLAFLDGGNEATRLILERDWSAHLLGNPESWPTSLKTSLSLILNSPESMILCWGRDELFFFFNETYFPLLGPRLAWAMGERFDKVWADAWDQAKPIVDAAFAGSSQRFADLPWKLATDRGASDTWWTFSYSRILDEAGDIAGLFVFTNETTSRVLIDRELVDSQNQLQALNETLERQVAMRTAERDRMWNASPDLMVVLSPDHKFQSVNPAWNDVLGYDRTELIGRTPMDFVHPDDIEIAKRALAAPHDSAATDIETRLAHRDGTYRWIDWKVAPGGDEIFAIGRHVTAAKEAEEQLRSSAAQLQQAQKMEAIGQLTGGVAHDFNNLLTIIKGGAELLRREGLTDLKRAQYIDAISDTATRAAKLTGQLLAFARRQALTPEVIDVPAAVVNVGEMVRTICGSRIIVELKLPADTCLAEIDRSQFETAVVNMAVNARDAMDGEGRMTISVGPVSGIPAMRIHPAVAGDFVGVVVTDTGAGISPYDIDRIFEPFFTTKAVGKGTGLGLSQVIGFAKQSGGDIGVESRVGEGTTFSLYLPRIVSGMAASLPEIDKAPTDGSGHCVLIVEDNDAVGQFATDALRELGYESVHALDGLQALSLLEAHPNRFDVVFSDVVMPGMNGIELGNAVRTQFPALPVILTSGYSHVLAENGQHGFELLHKPYSIEQLSRVLQKAVAWKKRKQA